MSERIGTVAVTKAEWEGGRRAKTLDWFRKNFYGYAPPKPTDEKFDDAGVSFANGEFKIRTYLTLPKGASAENPAPVFLNLDHYLGSDRKDGRWFRLGIPTNTITSAGYAYLNVNLNDIALNAMTEERMFNKVHRFYGRGRPDSWGTISAWAWGVSRVMDWIETRPELDAKRVAVVGHSRGGKTALWAAAQDERIAMAVPNCSGTGGTRWLDTDLPEAEPLEWMLGHWVQRWYCENLVNRYRLNGDRGRTGVRDMPYTPADLVQLVCPRLVYVASGTDDSWAGPQGEFETARRASALWREYGYRGLGLAAFPREGTWDHSGRVGYSLRNGPHDLNAWNWERLIDFADKHMKEGNDDGASEPRCTAGDALGLYGHPALLRQRIDRINARHYNRDMKIALKAWRGERVNAQVVVWSDADQGNLATGAVDFKGVDGTTIGGGCVKARFVRVANARYGIDKWNFTGRHDVADCLDESYSEWTTNGFKAVWFSLDVPQDAKPGTYVGEYSVRGRCGEVKFPVTLEVLDRALPAVKDRKFFLDLWQHPWSIAKYYKVKPFSKEHYRLMEPVYRELATGPQKVITTSIVDMPWGEGYASECGDIRTMVEYVRNADGTYTADFRNFDAFVEFAKKCGLGPQIHCYSIVKFLDRHIFYYTDGETGERRAEELYEGTDRYEAFLTPLLQQLERHLVEKGWIDDAFIGVDEVVPERLPVVRNFLRKVAPRLKFALASNVDPFRYSAFEKDVDVFSQILWTGHGITNLFTKAFDEDFLGKRRKEGRLTTFYVCTAPQQPNTWFESPLIETEWIGLYAAAKKYDGFLRWAAFLWGKDPFEHPEIKGCPTGENILIYPGGRSSMRWELLKDSMENWEKVRILREEEKASVALEKALGAFNYPFTGIDDADVYSLWRRIDQFEKALDQAR